MPNTLAHLTIGSLLFDGIDQFDLTGPFGVFARIPDATYRIYGLSEQPVRDINGLQLTPDATIEEAPQLDLLHVPGGFGQERLMDDQRLLEWLARQASGAICTFSVCTGALLLGAAGALVGKRATTHWSALDLLAYFGATPVDDRVVVDGRLVTAAGVTAGIDGALSVAAHLRGIETAQEIQLHIAYAPQPPFHSGTPQQAPTAVLARAREATADLTRQRTRTAINTARRLGLDVDSKSVEGRDTDTPGQTPGSSIPRLGK